jgi:hypothetical protein
MIRGDLSNRLIHLTSGESTEDVFRNFLSILKLRRLIGNDGKIKGGYKCVCFSEAPVSILGQMLAEAGSRYAPYGVMVDKKWLYSRGGRPVIYQSEAEFLQLPEAFRHRHVRYEPGSGIDFTWEREWRIAGDVEIPPDQVTLVVPNRKFPDLAKEHVGAFPKEAQETERGFYSLDWHYVALSDLGVEIGIELNRGKKTAPLAGGLDP